jgi:hypothetical protein
MICKWCFLFENQRLFSEFFFCLVLFWMYMSLCPLDLVLETVYHSYWLIFMKTDMDSSQLEATTLSAIFVFSMIFFHISFL